MESGRSAAESLALLRRQRHSLLNHLQVISGWLQLGRPERAAQYLESFAARLGSEGEAMKSLPEEVALTLIDRSLEAETYGVELEWVAAGPVSPEQLPEPNLLNHQLSAAIHAVSRLAEGDRRIRITLGAMGLTVHTPRSGGEA